VLSLMRMKEMPDPANTPPGLGDKVLHASFRVGGDTLMASDGHCQAKGEFRGISLALTVDNPAEAERRFKALAEQGQVQMPLTQTFFSPSFGMLADRFGVTWMVMAKA
jgi:PhnB protein